MAICTTLPAMPKTGVGVSCCSSPILPLLPTSPKVNTVVALDTGADAGADEEDADEEGADVAPEVDGAELPEPLLPQAASSPAAVMTAAAASSAPLGPAARAAAS